MSEFYAKVILDSVAPNGKRLTTMEVCAPRFILAEINTHRALSRNSASSRAIPVKKRIADIKTSPVEPVSWGVNKPGMQASEVLSLDEAIKARDLWHSARMKCLEVASKLDELKVHKQIANRVIENWAWNKQVITATDWVNHDFQRDHKDAQPEHAHVARLSVEARKASKPKLLKDDEWHTPYILEAEYATLSLEDRKKCSVARCARVSGVNFETGKYDIEKDLALFARLTERVDEEPGHWSPTEHVARPIPLFSFFEGSFGDNCDWCFRFVQNTDRKNRATFSPRIVHMHDSVDDRYASTVCWRCAQGHVTSGNFVGWHQFRKDFEWENRDL
jgi:hypothetical protein